MLAGLLCLLMAGGESGGAAESGPNIVIILSDDMGYSDVGCFGGEIRTPVLDQLAANGLRMTQFYNTGRCCPTRAALGTSLVPAFTGKPWTRSSPLFWEHEGNRAVRDGKWKLVANGPRGPWELYDLEVDRSEMHDLAGQLPDRVAGMKEQWESWARRVGVQPWPVTRAKQ